MSQLESNTTTPPSPVRTAADASWIETYSAQRTEPAAPKTEGDFQALYEASQIENAKLNHLIEAARFSAPPASSASTKTLDTVERIRARIGEDAYRKLTREERLTAVGVDPTISDEFLLKLFGRKFVPTLQRDLHRTDPAKYSRLRQAARILGLDGM